MFTGLIQTVGTLQRMTTRGNYKVLKIAASFADEPLQSGESICCDGTCLTVTSFDESAFEVDVSQESIARTVIGRYRAGANINLERALKSGDRLGGHMVNGHIDDIGTVEYSKSVGESIELAVTFNSRFDDYAIDKGSVAIDGVSLTINTTRSGWLSVNIVPLTGQKTNLGKLKTGSKVNLEFDMIGKYVAKMIHRENKGNLTIEKLRESGW